MNMDTKAIRTIVVAIDCSPHSKASLDAAATMASRLKAELVGIFVEDLNLLRMAGLPFTEEIRLYSSTTAKIDEEQLERVLKLQAREARELLERTVAGLTVPHTFRVLRGMVSEQLISAATGADILVLGRSGRSPTCRKGLGSTARSALAESDRTVMLMRPGFPIPTGPLLVLFDGSEGSKRALGTAIAVAGPENTLQLILLSADNGEERQLRNEAEAMIRTSGIPAEYHHLPPVGGNQLARFIRMIDSGLLVLSDRMNLPEAVFRELVNDIDYPVLVVR
jgi:nucleotide-binding universal stress UspA family protein